MKMNRFFSVAAVSALIAQIIVAEPADTAVGHHLISERGGTHATVDMGNKVLSWGTKTHVVWQEMGDDGRYWAAIRTLDRKTGEWSKSVALARGTDNHSRPALTVDSEGFLHVVIGGHNSPFLYMCSVRPNDSSAWTGPVSFGRGTYPSLVCGPGNVLVLAARTGSRNGEDLYLKYPGEDWRLARRCFLLREPQYRTGYAGYNAVLCWSPDKRQLHFACDVYEGQGTQHNRGTNQLVVYMVSDDLGATWRRSNGSLIDVEPYPKNMDVLAEDCRERPQRIPTPVLRLVGMIVDSDNRPYVLYIDDDPVRGKACLVTPDGHGGWTERPLYEELQKEMPGWGALSTRGAITIKTDDTMQICLPVAPLDQFGVPGHPRIDKKGVQYLWFETADGGRTFDLHPTPIAPDAALQQNKPTLERPTGYNVIGADRATGILYFVGIHRWANAGEVIHNRVYFTEMPNCSIL